MDHAGDNLEEELIRKLRLIQALHARPGSDGERAAAEAAMDKLHDRLIQERQAKACSPVEFTFTVADEWRRRLLTALMRKHGIKPYRYARQRRTTVMAKASKIFVDGTLWPQYEAMSRELAWYLEEATRRTIAAVMETDDSEAAVVSEPKQLSFE